MDHDHDHVAATHKMACPICGEELLVHAHDDEEAVEALMRAGKMHFGDVHEDEEGMSEEEMEKTTREKIQKV